MNIRSSYRYCPHVSRFENDDPDCRQAAAVDPFDDLYDPEHEDVDNVISEAAVMAVW